ncbi:MAG: threonine synthase [Patescibacteria group bacterium]
MNQALESSQMNTLQTEGFVLRSVIDKTEYPINEIRYRGEQGELLELHNTNLSKLKKTLTKQVLHDRLTHLSGPFSSGVWRYKELILPLDDRHIVAKPEGNTNLYSVGSDCGNGYRLIGEYANISQLYLKHEGENPTGSFKDRGMTVGASVAHAFGARAVACASTGNTSAALASYAAQAGMKGFVFIPEGKISFGKLSQSMAYGACTIQIQGDFDAAMKLVEEVCNEMGIYLLNSVNPFRIEGQKTIAYELMQQLNWTPPDWIVLPAGNLGNTSAIGKGLFELHELGLIPRIPKIAAIQAAGANPFYQSYTHQFETYEAVEAETIATAIRIGNPVSYSKAREVIRATEGVVEHVVDQEILDAKAHIDKAGIGCEPASATTVAGLKKLVAGGVIKSSETVAAILTGHLLKDPDTSVKYHTQSLEGFATPYANTIIEVEPTLKAVSQFIEKIVTD